MSVSAIFSGRLSLSLSVCIVLLLSFSVSAQVTQTLGSLDVDRLGAAVYSLPISAPNGVGNVKPNIAALYNSQAANGLLGKGGSIGGLSAIKRCPQTLVRDGVNKAISWSAEDRFCIDSQRLMLVVGTQGTAESQYKTEIDNGVVYTAKGGAAGNPDYFEAYAEDGATLIFGGVATAKEQGATTMTWALSQYKDVANNAIEYVYEGTAADGLRIKRINYAFAIPNTTNDLGAYIEFIYTDRDDPISKYVAGYEFRTNKLLTQINSYSLLGLLHRSYQIDYRAGQGAVGYISRMQNINECDTYNNCFYQTRFTWGTTKLNEAGIVVFKDISFGWIANVPKHNVSTARGYPDRSLSSVLDVADLNGNGINDFVWTEQDTTEDSFRTFTALDVGVYPFDRAKYSYSSLSRSDIDGIVYPKYEFGDVNADGYTDLLTSKYTEEKDSIVWRPYFSTEAGDLWGKTNGQNFSGKIDFLKVLDLDGDGFDELLAFEHSKDAPVLYRTKSIAGKELSAGDYYDVTLIGSTPFSDIQSKEASVKVGHVSTNGSPLSVDITQGDFDGDGDMDLVTHTGWIHTNGTRQTFKLNWYSLEANVLQLKGTIYEETRTSVSQYGTSTIYQRDAISMSGLSAPDINGDGLADITFKLNRDFKYALNTGNGFTEFKTFTSISDLIMADVNRDGFQDAVWWSINSSTGRKEIFVRYWNSALADFSAASLLRETDYVPYLFADFTGDGWLDILEYDEVARRASKESMKIYGFTNTSLQSENGGHGVLNQDAITSVHFGAIKVSNIDYQTLIRPGKPIISTCTSRLVSRPFACQDHWGASHYKPTKIEIGLAAGTLSAVSVDSTNFYTKTNAPFSGLNNPYFGSTRVSQYISPLPLVTRIKTVSTNHVDGSSVLSSEKKYYYWSLRTQAGGRGLLGFERTSTADVVSGERSEISWRQDWPFTGQIESSYLFDSANKLKVNLLNQYAVAASSDNAYGVFRTSVQGFEYFYAASGNGDIITSNKYSNGVLLPPVSSSSSTSSFGSSSSASNTYPKMILWSPKANLVQTFAYPDTKELPLHATPHDVTSQITNSDGTNPRVYYYVNGLLQNNLKVEENDFQKWWTPPMAGEFIVEASTTLEDGTVLRSPTGIFRLTQSGAPLVNLILPKENARYLEGDAILISALASDEGSITNVRFYDNGILIGADDSTPYVLNWIPSETGYHRISAVATDNAGMKTQSTSIKVYVDPLDPMVVSSSSSSTSSVLPYAQLIAPKENRTEVMGLGAEVPLAALVRNRDGSKWLDNNDHEAKIEFYENGNKLQNIRKEPGGSLSWWKPTQVGEYKITALAHLGGGRSVFSGQGTVRIIQVGAPVVSLISPVSNGFIKLGDSLNLSATASDPENNISVVKFYINDKPEFATSNANSTYAYTWTPAVKGTYYIHAIATDTSFVTSTSSTVKISVVEPGNKPAITLISPDNGANIPYGSMVSLFANAQDFDGVIAKVEFYANDQLIGSSVSSPFTSNFMPRNVGVFALKAVAYDNLGNASTSDVHHVQHGLTEPSLSAIELDDDCFFGVNFNASKNSADDLVFELYERLTGTEWPVEPVAQKSISLGNLPPFKVYFADHVPGDFEYRGRICPINNIAACSAYSAIMPIVIYSGCKSFTLPTVKLLNPPTKLKVGDSVLLNAEASTTKYSINSVRFYYGDKLLGVDYTAPYSVSWVVTETGRDYLYAQAEGSNEGTAISDMHIVDVMTAEDYANGASTSASRSSSSFSSTSAIDGSSISSISSSQSSKVAQIALFSPEVGKAVKTYLGDELLLLAAVYDQDLRPWKNKDGSSPRIEYIVNNQVLTDLRNDVASGIKYWRPTVLGNYGIKATAYLDDGKTVTTGVGIISVVKPQPPSINLELLQGAQIYSGSAFTLLAKAIDPDSQAKEVKFFANGEQISLPDFDAPYEASWIPVVSGEYQIETELLDKAGNRVRSPVRTVAVSPAILPNFDGVRGVSDYGNALLQGLKWTTLNSSDALISKTPNTAKISYNKLTKFNVNRPLKIINRSDAYANGLWSAKLIIIDASEITLNSSIEIIGEPADILFVNSSVSKKIQCSTCGFKNVGRVTFAVASPLSALSATSTNIGILNAQIGGVITIDNLQASGVVSVEAIAEKITSTGIINTQQYTVDVDGESIGDVVIPGISKVVGSGGVSLLHGRLDVDYEALQVKEIRTGAVTLELGATITSGAVNVISAAAVNINSILNTASELKAVTQYQGKLHAQAESITIKSLSADGVSQNSIIVNSALITDGKAELISQADIRLNSGQAKISGHKLVLTAKNDFKNYGELVARQKLRLIALGNVEPTINVVANLIENRGSIGIFEQSEVNSGSLSDSKLSGTLSLVSKTDVLNRFGGLLKAKIVNVVAENGRVRNGSLYAFDDSQKEQEAIAAANHTTQAISTLGVLPISVTKPYLHPRASIQGLTVQLEAKTSVENINPYTEPVKLGSEEQVHARVSKDAQLHIDDVRIEAVNKLVISAPGYVLNSSASLGVSEFSLAPGLIIESPQVRNERYYSYTVLEAVDETKQVVEQNPGSTTTTTSTVNGVQARYGFYSPPGIIYSFAPVHIKFGSDVNNSAAGLLNNAGFIDIYNTVNLYGVGRVTSFGVKLDKLAYETTSNTRTVLNECISRSYWNGYTQVPYKVCEQGSYDKIKTPEGKYLEPILDNTLFAVSGRLDAQGIFFSASNHEVLKDIREQVINDYITAQKGRKYHQYDPNLCEERIDARLVADGLSVITNVTYITKVSANVCPPAQGYSETKAVSELVAAKVKGLPYSMNAMISSYESWKSRTAQ